MGDDRNFDFGTSTDRPLTVAAGTPKNACGDTPAASAYSPTGFFQPACFLDGTLIGNLGRNAGTKPYDLFTDIGISKLIPLGERASLLGRVDVFNLINRFNVSDVNPLWDSGQKADRIVRSAADTICLEGAMVNIGSHHRRGKNEYVRFLAIHS